MQILLDECLPRKVKTLLTGYEIYTVREMNWTGFQNGELIKKALETNFDIFITVDKNLRYQQNISN